jgi:hypothetical protein
LQQALPIRFVSQLSASDRLLCIGTRSLLLYDSQLRCTLKETIPEGQFVQGRPVLSYCQSHVFIPLNSGRMYVIYNHIYFSRVAVSQSWQWRPPFAYIN